MLQWFTVGPRAATALSGPFDARNGVRTVIQLFSLSSFFLWRATLSDHAKRQILRDCEQPDGTIHRSVPISPANHTNPPALASGHFRICISLSPQNGAPRQRCSPTSSESSRANALPLCHHGRSSLVIPALVPCIEKTISAGGRPQQSPPFSKIACHILARATLKRRAKDDAQSIGALGQMMVCPAGPSPCLLSELG